MASMKRESAFVGGCEACSFYFLGFIPWGRVSSAYGYAQAQESSLVRVSRRSELVGLQGMSLAMPLCLSAGILIVNKRA